jgi:hypothetical protein
MIMRKKTLMQVLFLCLLSFLFQEQTKAQSSVTGVVTNARKEPLSGATVTVKGSSVGTSTDDNGRFTLNPPAGATTVVVSYTGYASKEATISGQSLTIQLTEEASSLSDVVVVGYGTARKKDLTGAVASVAAKDFNKGNFASPDQLIQGKVAGVQIINNSGQPVVQPR